MKGSIVQDEISSGIKTPAVLETTYITGGEHS